MQRHPERVARLALITPGMRAVGIRIDEGSREAATSLQKDEPWYDEAIGAFRRDWTDEGSDEDAALAGPFWYGRWDEIAQEHHATRATQLNGDARTATTPRARSTPRRRRPRSRGSLSGSSTIAAVRLLLPAGQLAQAGAQPVVERSSLADQADSAPGRRPRAPARALPRSGARPATSTALAGPVSRMRFHQGGTGVGGSAQRAFSRSAADSGTISTGPEVATLLFDMGRTLNNPRGMVKASRRAKPTAHLAGRELL